MDVPSLILDNDENSFCIYGLGKTGSSVVNYFNRKGFTEYKVWDDDKILRSTYGFRNSSQKEEELFSQHLDSTQYIVLSPGINIKKAKLKKN